MRLAKKWTQDVHKLATHLVPHAVLEGANLGPGGDGVEGRFHGVVIDGHDGVEAVVAGPGLGHGVAVGPL